MSLYLLVPNEVKSPFTGLARAIGVHEPLATGTSQAVIKTFLESAGGALSRFQDWSLLEVPLPEGDRLRALGEVIGEQISEDGVSLLDLEEKLLTLAEVQAVAAAMGYAVGLVAVVKPAGKDLLAAVDSLPPASDTARGLSDLDAALMTALGDFGGTVSLTELRRYVKRTASDVRSRLDVLASLGRVVRIGPTRYALPGHKEHWMQAKVLKLLAVGPLGSGQLCHELQTSYGKLRSHLSALVKRGVIDRTGSGFKTEYQLRPEGSACSDTSG